MQTVYKLGNDVTGEALFSKETCTWFATVAVLNPLIAHMSCPVDPGIVALNDGTHVRSLHLMQCSHMLIFSDF